LATYPASIVTHGQALNITCQSYAGYMNFGYTGCHSSMPSMQRLAVYTGEALQELEAALGVEALEEAPKPVKAAPFKAAKPAAKRADPAKKQVSAVAVKPKAPAPKTPRKRAAAASA
jgi:hypothetical protein